MLAAIWAISLGCSGSPVRGDDPPQPVLVELFTSQGCSSCPPADRLLEELGNRGVDGPVVALAFHVDYWNYLGWPDPFAQAAWSDRQRGYAAALGLDTIYTPQLVVNGVEHVVGSDRDAVERQIRDARSAESSSAPIVSARLSDGRVQVAVEVTAPAEGSADLMLAVYENGLTTEVPRGENARRTLTNHHVVRELRRERGLDAGERFAGRVDIPLDPAWRRGSLGVAVFLQDPATREVVAVAATPVRRSG